MNGATWDGLLHQLVEARAGTSPGRSAVVHGTTSMTFGELDRRAQQLAHRLVALGVGVETRVGLFCGRSPAMAIGHLGILKAGASCVPLDPSHPLRRHRFVIDDAGARVIVADSAPPPGLGDAPVVVVSGCDDAAEAARMPAPTVKGVAYVIYTSGSTGSPKGVGLTHQGLVNHAVSMSRLFELGPNDRVLQFASIAFDLSLEEIFSAWHAGAAVVLRPPDLPVLGEEWLRWLVRERITVMDLPTGYWERWVRDLAALGAQPPAGLRLLVVGGEQPSPRAYARWIALGGDRVRWLNTYGPTEASIVATSYEPPRRPVERLPIGRPIPNVAVHVLDDQMVPVADGIAGNLYLGGVGVAPGYVGRAAQIATSFLDDPFTPAPDARLFKTGDLVRRWVDGNLEFLGRVDRQLKVRGARVEPVEVEAALVAHPDVEQAVVVGHEDGMGELRLVAYCVSRGALPSPAVLRAHLAASLPDQLVPSSFVSVDALPLTASGKVDRSALPSPPGRRPAELGKPIPPRTLYEAALAEIWAEVLELDEVGVEDNFFDLGGHSLLSLQAVFLARQRLRIALPAGAVVSAPTVAALAVLAEGAAASGMSPSPSPVALVRGEELVAPLSLQQEWMWGLEGAADPPGLYNLTVHQRFVEPVDRDAIEDAIGLLVNRHEALHTIFRANGNGAVTAYANGGMGFQVEVQDVTEEGLDAALTAHNSAPFDLAAGPPVRAAVLRLAGAAAVEVAITCDHLVADGVSVGLLLNDLSRAYAAFAAGKAAPLGSLPMRYADYARWQRAVVDDDRLSRETAYWTRQLAGMPLGPGIPFDRPAEIPRREVRCCGLEVHQGTYRDLIHLAHGSSMSLFPLCVAAVQAVVARRSGRTDVVVSTMFSGRQRRELEGVVGLFSGVARLRSNLYGDPTFRESLGRVRSSILGAIEHQNVPFGRVRQALRADAGTAGDPGEPANLPVDVQYFPSSWQRWQPGSTVMARHPRHGRAGHYFGRGQRHPLMVEFFDDGRELWANLSYKPSFYDDDTIDALAQELGQLLVAAAKRPDARLSGLFGQAEAQLR